MEPRQKNEDQAAAPWLKQPFGGSGPKNPFDVTWQERVLALGSVVGAIIVTIVLGWIYDPQTTGELFGLVPTSFFLAGKFLPLWAATGRSSLGPYELGVVIWIMDTLTVLLIVYSLEGLSRIGFVGRLLERVWMNATLLIHAFPRVKKLTIVGIVLFVLFPVAGTGAIGGSFLGALMRVHRFKLIAAVSVGGFLGGMSMAFATEHFREAVQKLEKNQANPFLLGGLILAAILIVWLLNRAYRKALERVQREGLTKSGVYRIDTERPKD